MGWTSGFARSLPLIARPEAIVFVDPKKEPEPSPGSQRLSSRPMPMSPKTYIGCAARVVCARSWKVVTPHPRTGYFERRPT